MTENQKATQDQAKDELPDFAVFLVALARGRTHEELSKALRDVTAAVVATGKAGSLSLRIDIKPQGNTEALTVTDKVSLKLPAYDRQASIFFVDEGHNLVRNNPNQANLFEEPTKR